MDYRIGMKVFGNWTIVKSLGEGGYGKVFEIRRDEYGIVTTSALKVIKIPKSESEIRSVMNEGMTEDSIRAMYSQVVNGLVKEISALSSLKSHPNIVHYEDHLVMPHDNGIGADILIRMELLVPLNDYLADHIMQEKEVIFMAKELCSALDYCELKGLVHRDVKPENTFVDERGHFKLGDFGIARTIGGNSGTMTKVGTDLYMAPEVFLNRSYGKTVDIYSLGLMLYKLMNRGRLPFFPLDKEIIQYQDRENALQRRIRGDRIPLPADASMPFAKIIMKACEYQPERRYQHAKEMLSDLNMLSDIQTKSSPSYTNSTRNTHYQNQEDDSTIPLGFQGRAQNYAYSNPNYSSGKTEKPYHGDSKERTTTPGRKINSNMIAIAAIVLIGIVTVFSLTRQLSSSNEQTDELKPTKVVENKPETTPTKGVINSENTNGRMDIASYVGGNIDAFTNKENYLELTKNDESEIKWESKYVSLTATGNGIITRVRLQREEKSFSVEGLYPGLDTSEFESKLRKKGYDYVGVSADGKWEIFHNSETSRYFAVTIDGSSDVIESLYYAMDGYLPVS